MIRIKCLECEDEFIYGFPHRCGERKVVGIDAARGDDRTAYGVFRPLECDVTIDGGVHSHIEGRYDLIPPEAMRAIAVVMEEGVKAGRKDDNWRKVPQNLQINHALSHLMEHLMGMRDEDHLAHALTRLAMAVAVRRDK